MTNETSALRSFEYRLRVRINGLAHGTREKLADALRTTADKIDRRVTLAIAIDSDPPITAAEKKECVESGAQAVDRAAHIVMKQRVIEDELKRIASQLYADKIRSLNA